MIKVKDFKTLLALPNHSPEELALVEDENKVYVYKDEWVEYNPEDGGLTLTLYDVNKLTMPNLPDLTNEQIDEAKRKIAAFIPSNTNYWMLLNNEKRYYTVFHLNKAKNVLLCPKIEDEIIECLTELGAIKSIEIIDDNTVEAWVIDKDDETAYVYYLFNYDGGIVECK